MRLAEPGLNLCLAGGKGHRLAVVVIPVLAAFLAGVAGLGSGEIPFR
jgi:hypothetical protein